MLHITGKSTKLHKKAIRWYNKKRFTWYRGNLLLSHYNVQLTWLITARVVTFTSVVEAHGTIILHVFTKKTAWKGTIFPRYPNSQVSQHREEIRNLSISAIAFICVVGNNKCSRGATDDVDVATFPLILSLADFTTCGGGTQYHLRYQARSIESTFSPWGHCPKFK